MVPHGAAPVREGVFPQEDGFEIMGIIKASRLGYPEALLPK